MKNIITSPLYRTYYVNGGIIYEIKNTTVPTTDTHAIIYKEGSSFPYLTYEDKNTGVKYTYYLDSLIGDGDKLNSGAFSKICHEISGEPEKTPFDYFKYLCEQQIASAIADTVNYRSYSFYYDPSNGINRLTWLGAPDYMFKQNYDDIINGSTFLESNGVQVNNVTKNNVIDFTEEKYNQLLADEILRRATEAANRVANQYGKKVATLTLTNQ